MVGISNVKDVIFEGRGVKMKNSAGKTKTSGQSRDDYLEAILRIVKKKGQCRSVDIASLLDVSRPSVSIAMRKLAEDGYIDIDDHKKITLTARGKSIARETFNKHLFFKDILVKAGIDEETAESEACEMEHCISKSSFKKIKEYYESL